MRPTLMSILEEQAHRVPDRPVAVWGKNAPTYPEAYSLATVLARYFIGVADLGPGDAVLLSSPNSLGQFCALAAIQACGAKAVLAPCGMGRAAFDGLVARERPGVALVADPEACASVREALPDAPVFSMGAAEVDAPSMGYMADQAIGLVDEVYLKVEDFAFDDDRDVDVAFFSPEGGCIEASSSALALAGERIVAEKGLADGARVSISASFSSQGGVERLYAALSVGATIDLVPHA